MFSCFKTRIITSNPPTSFPRKTNKELGIMRLAEKLDWKGLRLFNCASVDEKSLTIIKTHDMYVGEKR
jgi:hypothetical protein